jgi:hypothetical protein
MRPNNPPRNPRHTTHKHDPAKLFLLHRRNAQLREQVRGSTIDAPRLFKRVNGDVGHGLYAALPARGACVVDENCGCAERVSYGFVKRVDLLK